MYRNVNASEVTFLLAVLPWCFPTTLSGKHILYQTHCSVDTLVNEMGAFSNNTDETYIGLI